MDAHVSPKDRVKVQILIGVLITKHIIQMSTFKFYSKEEDAVILRKVSENPTNITKALKEAANIIGRTFSGVQQRWCVLKKNNPCFEVKSDSVTSVNVKNTKALPSDILKDLELYISERLQEVYNRGYEDGIKAAQFVVSSRIDNILK